MNRPSKARRPDFVVLPDGRVGTPCEQADGLVRVLRFGVAVATVPWSELRLPTDEERDQRMAELRELCQAAPSPLGLSQVVIERSERSRRAMDAAHHAAAVKEYWPASYWH